MDVLLASEDISVLERPEAAVIRWLREKMGGLDITPVATAFKEGFGRLHPSVNFGNKPFMYLCVSAQGAAYELHPPLIFGDMSIDPIRLIKISGQELQRIYDSNHLTYWEMCFQAADGIDLFTAGLNFNWKSRQGALWAKVGQDQLQATGRQLVASSADASLPQAVALIAEMMVKAVLAEDGVEEAELKRIGHDLEQLYRLFLRRHPDVNDAEVFAVASTLPAYVPARFCPPRLTMRQAQDLYRRALFLSAETVRRGQKSSVSRHIAAFQATPSRDWTVPQRENAFDHM